MLIDYGDAFPGWLAAFPPAAGVPCLGDVARLEWAWSRAYNAADAVPLGAEKLAELVPELHADARLILHPSAMVVVSQHPIVSIWAESTGRAAVRPGDAVEVRRVDIASALLLASLGRGETLGGGRSRGHV